MGGGCCLAMINRREASGHLQENRDQVESICDRCGADELLTQSPPGVDPLFMSCSE